MKKQTTLALACTIALGAITLTSCGSVVGEEENGNTQITLPDEGDKAQTVYADDEEQGVTFTAKSDWTASVSETTRASGAAWIKLYVNGEEKYSGGAGTINLVIVIEPNTTGDDRRATITITCGGEKLNISVDQKGVTEDNKPLTAKDLIVAHPWKIEEFYNFYPDREDNPETPEDERYSYETDAPGAIFTFSANNTVSVEGESTTYEVFVNMLRIHATHENGTPLNMDYNIVKLTSTEFEATGAFQGMSQEYTADENGNEIEGPIVYYTYYQTYKFVKP